MPNPWNTSHGLSRWGTSSPSGKKRKLGNSQNHNETSFSTTLPTGKAREKPIPIIKSHQCLLLADHRVTQCEISSAIINDFNIEWGQVVWPHVDRTAVVRASQTAAACEDRFPDKRKWSAYRGIQRKPPFPFF